MALLRQFLYLICFCYNKSMLVDNSYVELLWMLPESSLFWDYNSLILQGHEIFSILSDKFSLDGAQKIKTIKAKILVGTLNLHLMSSTTSICFHKIMLHPVWPKFSLEHSPVYSGNYYKNLDRQNLFNLLPCIINNIGK